MAAMSQRITRLRAAMTQAGVDLAAVGPGADLAYLSGAKPHPDERLCLLLVGPAGESMVVPKLNADEVRGQTAITMHTHDDAESPLGALKAALQDVGAEAAKEVAIEDGMRADFGLDLLDVLPQAKLLRLSRWLGPIRAKKDATELAALRRNAAQADAAVQALAAAARVGMTERQLADVARAAFTELGARPTFSIVGAGANGAFPHHATSDRVIVEGDAVVVDVGGASEGYCSDITRMLFFGQPSERYLHVHGVVERAVQAALAAVRPGARAHEVDDAARAVITEAGFGPRFTHRVGHGIGMTGHELPYLTASSQLLLEEGMTHSVEPGIYLEGEFGIRLEEIVAVGADGPEVFSKLSRDPIVVLS